VEREAGRSTLVTLVRSPIVAVLVAAALFAAVVLLRWHVAGMPVSVAIGYAVPVALLAVRFGPWAGFGAALLALGLLSVWDQATPAPMLPVQYGALTLVFLLIGIGLGWYSDQLRREDRKQQRAFAELKESQQRYQALMEHAPEAIVVLDVDENSFYEVNENACRFFELSRTELMQREPGQLSLPVEPGEQPAAETARQYVQQAVQGGTPVFEWTYRARSGRVVPCEVRLVRLPHPDRVLVRGSITDISERKRTEAMLAAAEVASEVAARVNDLTRVTEAALSHLHLKDLLPELALRVRQILRVDNAGILLADRTGHLVLETASGVEGNSSPRLANGEGFAGRVAARRRPVMLRGSEVEQFAVNPSLRTLRSLLGVPLLSGDRLLGVLHVGSLQDRAFTDDEVNLLQLAAERAALGIDHAHVYEWQRSLANILQRSLLPRRLPEIPGVELQARYRPAGFQVGGDFYDVVALQDGRWMLFIGDVCGKGPEAAALTALARYTLRAEATHETRPAELLRLLNRSLLRDGDDDGSALLTAVCAVLGSAAGLVTLEVAAAGHPLPLVQRANGDVEITNGTGEILGVFADVNPATFVINLLPGDSTILYTDGLLDAQAPKSILDASDLAATLARSAGSALAERLAALEQLAIGDAAQARDDIAILAVRHTTGANISGMPAEVGTTVREVQSSPTPVSPTNLRGGR
jgi:sigma-B regulation protein RsbU (phosphoserine phosphatase)